MIWKWIAVCMACLLLFSACTKTPTPDETVQTTSTTVTTQEQKATPPPSIILNGTQTLEVSSYQWSRVEGTDLVMAVTDAPHPHQYFSEKFPMFYTKDVKTVSFSCEEVSPVKEVKVTAFKMSEKERKPLSITVTSATDKNGDTVYTAQLLTDDFYAYVVTLYWERYDNGDYSSYFFYSKVQ